MENSQPGFLKVNLKRKIYQSLPENSREILKFLTGKETYIVGGCLRDHLLERPIKDIDILVIGSENGIDNYFLEKEFTRIMLSQKEPIVRYLKQGFTYDLTFCKNNNENKAILIDNLKHRDFTINSLAISLTEFNSQEVTLIDPTGGLSDLKAGRIRCFNPENIVSDPLRLLRAFRLQCLLKFEIDTYTLEQIKANSSLIKRASFERIRDELSFIMGEESYATIKQLSDIGLLDMIFPEFSLGRGMYQGPYHDTDVATHSLHTLRELEKLLPTIDPNWFINDINQKMISGRKYIFLLKLSALLHDIGKPPCVSYQEGKVSFTGHDKVGGELVVKIALRLKLSKKESQILKKLIDNHLRVGCLTDLQLVSDKAKRRLIVSLGDDLGGALLLFLADALATRSDAKERYLTYLKFCQDLIKFKNNPPQLRKLLLNGNEIMSMFSLKPGRKVGYLTTILKKAQEEGVVKSKKQAKDYLIRYIKENNE